MMFGYLAAFVLGGACGVLLMCFAVASKERDRK